MESVRGRDQSLSLWLCSLSTCRGSANPALKNTLHIMSSQQRAQQQALGAVVASQIPTITEETVRRYYHEFSISNYYDCRVIY